MIIFLQCQFQKLKTYSIKKTGSSGIKVLAGLFFIASIFLSQKTYAVSVSFSGGTLTPATTTICAGDSTILTFTGNSVPSVAGPWTATYQWDSSSNGGITWFPIAGATGTISAGSPTITYNTSGLFVTTYYRVQLTGISASVVGTSYTSSNSVVTVLPIPAPISGNPNICLGATDCLSDATAGGTWSSTNTAVATVGTNGCVFGVTTGTSNIVYGTGSCTVLYSVTVSATSPISGPSSVCTGSTITLTDATAGVTWSSSATAIATVGSTTGVVTGASVTGGAVTILATSPVGCVAIKTINVNPDPAAIAGNPGICLGLTNCLSDATSGGTWSSSNTSVATVGSTGCVASVSTGTAIISYILGTTCFNTVVVTVNPLPAAISGTASVCAGQTTSLSDATTGGTWSSSNTAVATINSSGLVTGVAAGTATIVYTSALGCTVSVVVTVNPLGPINGDLNVCNGLTTSLTDAATGGIWSSGNANVTIGSLNGIVNGVSNGTSPITYTLPFGCVAYATVTVNPNPGTINGVTTICVGSTSALTDVGGGTWASSAVGVAQVGSNTGIVTGIFQGTAIITYTLPTGCFITTTVTVNPVSPISGNLFVCVGSTTSLSNSTGGGTWSSSNGIVGTVGTSGIVTGLSQGTTIISYALSSGCYATAIVTVNPLPNPISGNPNVCAWGGITCFTDAPGGGEWSSTLVVISTIGCVTGYDTGVGTITYSLPTGCMVTQSVTVNPLPDPITGNTTVCQGYTTTLNDGTPLGTWSSSNTSVASIGSNTGVVTGVSGGTSDITYTIIATGCTADTTVLVNPGPAPITGADSVCVGLTTSLSDVTPGGTWSSSNTSVATVGSTGIVTGGNSGTAIITYTLSTGCYVNTVVTVDALPIPISGVSNVCVGSTITLSDVGGAGTWSSSNTSVATIGTGGVVTGITAGTTTITYTLSTGCITTKVVTVNPINQIAGNLVVCVGLTTTLTDTTTGGTWSSSSTSTATIGSTSGTVTGVAGGNTTIIYTTAFGCTASAVVTVNPLPTVINGVLTVCQGYTTQLTDATAGGNWSSSASGIAGVGATGIVTGNAGGTATITYTLGTGCLTTAVVTVYPLTAITGTTSVCQGSSISLTDATAGGTWSSTNTVVGTVGTSGIVYGVSGGTTTISYILPTGCYATTVVTVNALGPVLGGNVGLCIGFSITLSDAASGGTWTSSNTAVATVGAITGVVTGVGTGVVTITDNLPGGCTASTTVTVNSIAAISGPGNVCQGSITLFSDATVGGTWSTSNPSIGTISATGNYNADGTSVGTTILSYSYGANCYVTLPVIVNPITAILGPNSVCPGYSVTLSDTTAGGTWTSSNTIIATVGSTSGIVFGAEPGTATIIYTVATGCTATSTVTVDIVYPVTGNLSLCLGGTTALTDITTGGTWSSSNGAVAGVGSTGIVTAAGTVGTSNITYTLPSGCVAVATVTVNPSPAPITGPTQICVGSTTTLSDPTLGGIWSSTDVVVSGSGNVAGITAYAVGTGVATITYELTPSGCPVYYQVTVNPLPSNINGNLIVCQGLTSTLSDVSTVGTWSSTNTGIATVGPTTGIVTGVSQGLDTIIYTLSTGCSTDTAFVVNGLPSPISGVASVCYGLTTSLSDASVGGTWSSGNTLMATVGSTGIVTGMGAAGGTVVITYTLPTGCINTVVVTVNPLPGNITGPTSVCVGQTITLVDGGGGTWTSTNTAVATVGSTTGIVTGVAQGATVITYTLGTGCITTTTINVNPLSPITGTLSLCVGLTTNLTDATTGGTWSSTNTSVATVGTSGIVTGGSTSGTSTISYVTAAGCITSVVVTVNPLPTVISGVPVVCVGQTTSLSDGTAGGIWTSGNTLIATVGSSSGIVTGMSQGTTTITYTLGSGCIEKIIVTVNPLGPINGSTNLCQGQTSTFTDAVAGTWSSSNTSIVTIGSSTGIATGGNTVGTATISFVTALGCTTSIVVTVNPIAPINGSSELCVGVTTIFTDAVTGGTWTSSNTSVATIEEVTGVITGVGGGTTTVVYQMPSGCSVSLAVTVTALAAINGQSSVCQGDSILLTDATSGGVWSVENTAIGSISSTGEFTGISSGTDIVSYSYGPSCVAFKAISIDPSTPITGDLNICFGLTTNLTDATLGGTWSSSNTTIASVNSEGIIGGFETVVVHGNNVGTAIISYVLPTGCTQTAVVTVNLTAAISGADSVCVGLTTSLTDATSGVTWSSSNTAVATVGSTTGVVTGVTQGTATITATSPVGCIATVVVTVHPLPSAILGNPVVCVGLSTTLSDLTMPGTWSSSNTAVATINSITGLLTGVSSGTATITWMLPTGCIATVVATVNALPAVISGSLQICVQSVGILSDLTAGGTWSVSNTNATIGELTGAITGVTAGLDTVTYTLGTGCITTAVLTVNPLPSAILGNTNICLGSTNVLSDATLGGTWITTNSNATITSSTGNSVSVFGNVLGADTIIYTLPTGCNISQIVSVDPLPLAITGADSVCVGSVTSLSDPTFGGTWSTLNTSIATVGTSTGIVTGVSADTVTVVYTIGTGCNVTVVVTVNPLPLFISGNFNVCLGTSNTLNDGTNGGSWSSSNTLVATVGSSTGVVQGMSLGTALITYTLNTGCFVTQEITVDPLPLAITGIDSVCVNSTTTLADATTGGTWSSSLPGIASVIDTTGVVTGVSAGTTTITYQLTATGCIATTVVTVHPLPIGISGQNMVCVGSTVLLTDVTTGGTWGSTNTSVATVLDSAGLVTGVFSDTSTGEYDTIIYTLPTGCSANYQIIVFPIPPAIMGPDSVCVGSTVQLSEPADFAGGTWSSSLPDTASISSVGGLVFGLSQGTTVITFTSNHGCVNTVVITVNPIPTPIYKADSVCNGFSVQLSDTSAGGLWSTTNSAIDSVNSTGLVFGLSPGSDSILYTYPVTGCRAVLDFTVHPIPVITVNSSNSQQICIGASVVLTASGAGPNAPPYIWTPTTGLTPTTGSPVTASPIVTTIYTVIGTTEYGCSSFAIDTVHVDSLLLHIHITGRDSICQGAYDTLIAGPTYIGAPLFAWTPNNAISTSPADTVYVNPTFTETYTAVLIDSFGCKDSASFKVTVNPLPIISVLPNPGIVCRGTPTTFTASGAGTGGKYAWYPNAFLSCDSCITTIASDTQNLVYKVYGTSIYGCTDSILFPVSVLDTTKLTLSSDTALCVGQCANLLVTSTSRDGSHPDYYEWTPAAGLNDPSSPNPTACPDTTTLYKITVKENACFSRTDSVMVFVEPYPAITITATPATTVLAGQPVTLTATITNGALLNDYAWIPATGLSCEKCYDPIATPSTTTTYTFTATSNYGCSSYDTITLNLTCGIGQVFIPNTFTPNGDGHNDRFYVSGTGISNITSMRIYNRWGEMVFQSVNTDANDPGAGWDGTYKGVVLEPDVFVYVVQVQCELGGKPFDFKGNVSLVR